MASVTVPISACNASSPAKQPSDDDDAMGTIPPSQATPRAQLLKSDSAIQMMENFLFNLKSDNTPWLSPSITTAAMDLILAFLCGLGLFYLITLYIPSNPPLPPPETRKKPRKGEERIQVSVFVSQCHVEKRGHIKSRRKSSTMKDRSCSREQLEEIYDLITLLTSYIGKLHDSSSFHDILGGNGLGEMLDSECSADHQSSWQTEEDSFTNTVFPVASPAPSTDCLEPLDVPLSTVLISSSGSLGSHTSQSVFQPPETLNLLGDSISPPIHSSSPVSSQPVACPPSMPDPILGFSPCDLMETPPGTTPPATNLDIQELLETEISNKPTLDVCQGREKEGEDKEEKSLRNILSSLDSEQDTATPQSFCNTKGKPEQLARPQQLILSGISANHLRQDGTQLFWGLPSLHSESLMHLSWKQTRSSSVQRLSFAFNYICSTEPQPKEAPRLSQAETLRPNMDESERWSQNIPPTVSQIHTEPHLPCSIQNHPPPSPSKIRNVPYSPLQQRKQPFILNEHQDLDRSLQQLNGRKELASKLQTTAEALIPPTGNLPQVSKDSQTYKLVSNLFGDSMSSNIQEHKETTTRDEQQHGCSLRQTVSQDLMQLPGKLTVNGQRQAQCKHELLAQTSQPSAIPCKGSNCVQKIDLAMVALNDPSKGVEHYQERDLSEDQAWSSGSTLVKGCKANLSEGDCIIPKTSQNQTSSYLPNTSNKKHVEKVLTFHMGRKLNQMKEGMIPVCVRQSCLAASHASPKPNAHVTSTNQSSYKCLPAIANTSQELSFLDAQTLLILETHIVRYRVRHKWDPQMQISDPGTLNLHETPALPLVQPAISSPPSTDSQVSSIAKVANSQEDLQEGLVEKMVKKMLSPTVQDPFSVHKPTELLKTQSSTLSGDIHGPAEAAPSRQDSLDVQYPRKNRPVLETGQGRLKPSPNLAVSMHEPGEMSGSIAFEEPCLSRTSPYIKGMSQLSVAETSETVEIKETPPPTGGASVIENSKIMNNGNISGSPKTEKSCSPSSRSILQDPVYTDLKSWVVSEIQKQVELKLEKQFQHQKAGIFQHGHTDKLSTQVSLPSWASGSTSQIMTGSKISTPQIKRSLKLGTRPSQEQPETKSSRAQVTGKNQSKMFTASDGRQGCRKLASGLPEERRAVVRPSQSCGLSPLVEVNEQGAIGRKSFPTSPQKAHNSTESNVHKRVQNFLHFANASTKERRQNNPLPKAKCSSVLTQRKPFMHSVTTEAQTLMTAVGKIVVDKLGLQHGDGPPEVHKGKPQTLLHRHFSYQTGSCDYQESSMIGNKGHGHQTGHKDPRYPPIKIKWAADRVRDVQRARVCSQLLPK
ncbi:PREDICTED: spermatogenesis-associated protein 31E1-like [Dipodomys ordii]|uniref:Spermatogenesis-associated protein 31E1-like n=1 Tax=Dipodomys ordii TaxID=10020 RepID=A0A1S3GQY8_DIPOR|nr:PREDICTED: spermatogenesis-associated protein 31E1-like [Dipodomys ordii]